MRSLSGFLVTAVLAVALAPAGTSAQEQEEEAAERLVLRWEAPESCPDAAALRAEVVRLLGGPVPSEGSMIHADARTSMIEDAYELTLRTEVEGVPGERVVRAERCEELVAAAALILALMIDPEAALRAAPEPSPSDAADGPQERAPDSPRIAESLSPPTVRLPRREPPALVQEPAPLSGSTVILGAGAVADVGTLPSPTAGVLIEGGAGTPVVDARLRAVFLFPQIAANPAVLPEASAELMAITFGALACVRPIDVARFVGLCAEVTTGSVFGRARGITNPLFGAGLSLAAGGGLVLAWQPIEQLDIEATAQVFGQILAPPFYVVLVEDGAPRDVVLFQPPGVTGRFGLSAHLRF